MILIDTKWSFCYQSELCIQRTDTRYFDRNTNFIRFTVLTPHLLEFYFCFFKLNKRVDKVGFNLSFLCKFRFSYVFNLSLTAELLEHNTWLSTLSNHLEIYSSPRLQCKRLREDFKCKERIIHLKSLAF